MCMVEIRQGFAKRLRRGEEEVVRLGWRGRRLGTLGWSLRCRTPSPAPPYIGGQGGCAPSPPRAGGKGRLGPEASRPRVRVWWPAPLPSWAPSPTRIGPLGHGVAGPCGQSTTPLNHVGPILLWAPLLEYSGTLPINSRTISIPPETTFLI